VLLRRAAGSIEVDITFLDELNELGTWPRLTVYYHRHIWPRLASVPLAEIVRAIGCSKSSASDIRRGKRTPHVSTWRALEMLTGMRCH